MTGDRIYYFPHLAVGASWQTTLTYINYSSQSVTCRTDFVSDHGGPLMVSFPGLGNVSSRTDRLPPGGSVHEETNVALQAPPASGWALAACSVPVKASLLFRQYGISGNPVAEAGVNAAAAPAARFVTFAERAAGQSGTGVAYANPSAAAADIEFTPGTMRDRRWLAPPGPCRPEAMPPRTWVPVRLPRLYRIARNHLYGAHRQSVAQCRSRSVFSSLPPGETDDAASGTDYVLLSSSCGGSELADHDHLYQLLLAVGDPVRRTSFPNHGGPLMVSFPGLGTCRAAPTPAARRLGARGDRRGAGRMRSRPAGRRPPAGSGEGQPAVPSVRQLGNPVAEAGVNAAAAPFDRFVTFAERAADRSGTGVAYANPSAKTTASVFFTARDEAGRELATVVRSLLPGGHDAHNLESLFGAIDFTGSLEVTSTEPIVSLSLNFEATPVFSSLPPGKWIRDL